MNTEFAKIIERVQKLLALAGNNPNEHEAAAAIEKAHGILAAHNLSMATVEQHQAKDAGSDERTSTATETNFSEKQYSWLWDSVAKLNYCFCFQQRPDPHKRATFYTIVGRPINVIITTQMAMYLCQTVRRLANEEAKRLGRTDHRFKNAFLAGAAARLHARLTAMRDEEQAKGAGNALVLWSGDEQLKNERFIAESMGVTLKDRKDRQSSYDSAGMRAGRAAGDRISLDQQVGSGTKRPGAIASK